MKMVKLLPEFEDFTVFLKNRNFISKIKRSKVTDYAALTSVYCIKLFLSKAMAKLFSNSESLYQMFDNFLVRPIASAIAIKYLIIRQLIYE